MAKEGSSARLVRNTLANGAGQMLGVLVSLVLTPYMIHSLGIAEYGVFTLALTFTFFGGFAALADLGVEGAIVRYVAEARADGDYERATRVVSTGFVLFVVVALVLTPAVALLASLLAHAFPIKASLVSAATLTFVLIAAQLLFELPGRALFAVLEGSQRFDLFQGIEALRAVVQAVLFVIVLSTGHGVVALALAMLASSVLVLVSAWVTVRRAAPEMRIRPRLASRSVLRGLVTFGGGLLGLRVLGTLYRQMDKLILASFLGVRPVTPYDVANKLHLGAGLVMSVSSSALLPASAYARSQPEVLEDLYLRGTHYSIAVTMPFIVGGFAFADPLINAWVGGALSASAAPAAHLFFIYLAIVISNVVGVGVLTGLGRIRGVLAIAIGITIVNLGVSIGSVALGAGIEGVVLGTVVATAVFFPAQLRLCLRQFKVSLRHFLRESIRPNVPGLIVQALTAVPLVALAHEWRSLPAVGALFAVSVATSMATWLMVGLSREQRQIFIGMLRRAVAPA